MSLLVRVVLPFTLLIGLASCAPDELHTTSEPVALRVRATTVRGVLTRPATAAASPAVVLLSGYGSNDMNETVGKTKPLRDIADGLGARGIATLRFDKPTLHQPAWPGYTPTEEYVDATASAIAFSAPKRPSIQAGSSCSATVLAARWRPAPRRVSTWPA